MSSQFKGKISIGRGGSIPGLIDEFYFFEKALSFNDVKDLSELCNVDGDYPIPMENGNSGISDSIKEASDYYSDSSTGLLHEHDNEATGHRHSTVTTKPKDNEPTPSATCHKQISFQNTDLRGSETSGVFNDVGDVTSLDECVKRCCAAHDCHIAYMKKKRCFTVTCHFPSLCQPVKVGRSLVHVAFVERNGESVYIKGILRAYFIHNFFFARGSFLEMGL